MESYPKIIALFYLLSRDHLPVGSLVQLVNEIRGIEAFEFTNPHLEAFAKDLTDRLFSQSKSQQQAWGKAQNQMAYRNSHFVPILFPKSF